MMSNKLNSIVNIQPRSVLERKISDELYFSDIDDDYKLMRFKMFENVKSRKVSVKYVIIKYVCIT